MNFHIALPLLPLYLLFSIVIFTFHFSLLFCRFIFYFDFSFFIFHNTVSFFILVFHFLFFHVFIFTFYSGVLFVTFESSSTIVSWLKFYFKFVAHLFDYSIGSRWIWLGECMQAMHHWQTLRNENAQQEKN